MHWIAALLVAWLVVDALVVAAMARMGAGRRGLAAQPSPSAHEVARAENTAGPASVRQLTR